MKAQELLIRSYIEAHFHSNKKNLSQVLKSIENSAVSCNDASLKQTILDITSQAKNKLPIPNKTIEGLKEYEKEFGQPSGGVSSKGFILEEQLNHALYQAREYLKTQLTEQLNQAINDTDTYNFSGYINQPQYVNHYHYTVLHVAILNDEKELFDSLLANKNYHKLNIDQAACGHKKSKEVNKHQITPLEESIFIKNEYYALQLIEHGADYTHKNSYNETCEDTAKWASDRRQSPTKIYQKILDKQRANSSRSTPDPQTVHSSPTSSDAKQEKVNWRSGPTLFSTTEGYEENTKVNGSNIRNPNPMITDIHL